MSTIRRILIIGATSAIAEAAARRWAAQGASLHLLGRNAERLAVIAQDLSVRGAAEVGTGVLDANDLDAHQAAVASARVALGGIDVALIAHGTLPDQAECSACVERTLAAFATNGSSTIALMTRLANVFEAQGEGTLAVLSSVAGDRGRASNAVYGAAKAAVTAYASALRQRLGAHGVNVLTIKPGFVDTPMTRHLAKGALWAKPDAIAAGIVHAVERRRSVVYLPGFWWPVMLAIKALPEFVFRRLKF
jgi:decaprenylphospho-beta-D-erythro-pentofuranosid-2-ulose 2-reductase